jgi:hypothetical protein
VETHVVYFQPPKLWPEFETLRTASHGQLSLKIRRGKQPLCRSTEAGFRHLADILESPQLLATQRVRSATNSIPHSIGQESEIPLLLEIEPTFGCNLRCVMCHVPTHNDTRPVYLDIDALERATEGVEHCHIILGSEFAAGVLGTEAAKKHIALVDHDLIKP